MTMDLFGAQGERTFTNTAWRKLIQLAVQHGWEPAGAAPPAGRVETAAAEEESNRAEPCEETRLGQRLQERCERNPEEVGPILDEMARESRQLAGIPDIDSYF